MAVRRVAIVGHSEDKFTGLTAPLAQQAIASILDREKASVLVSGGCPLGGVDIWAEKIAVHKGIDTRIFRPDIHKWDPKEGKGFKARNIEIAENCDVLYNVVVRDYPPHYNGKRVCDYHCEKRVEEVPRHVKSGGCWTAWRAFDLGVPVRWMIIDGTVWEPERG